MIVPDPKYLPKTKGKNKVKKTRLTISEISFPKLRHQIDARPAKRKKSPNGDNYVWAK